MKVNAREPAAQCSQSSQQSPATDWMRFITPRLLLLRASALAAVLLLPAATFAEQTTDTFACTLGGAQRVVNVTYLDTPGSVPCEIREQNDDNNYRVLWRANNDADFCQSQFSSFHLRLQTLGWQCNDIQSIDVSVNNTPAVVPASTAEAIQPELPATAAIATAPVATTAQVELIETPAGIQNTLQTPKPPSGKYGNLTADDIREMDDWLIYLSALTMDSIRQLAPDEGQFESYLQTEQLDATNIYQRLQNRVELLNRLLTAGARPNLSSTDF